MSVARQQCLGLSGNTDGRRENGGLNEFSYDATLILTLNISGFIVKKNLHVQSEWEICRSL